MTKEDNGEYLFRKQFETTSKKVLCRSEIAALSKFCKYIRSQQPVYIIGSDRDNVRILISKCREVCKEKFSKLVIKGYTSWRRSLEDFDQPICDLEEFYLQSTNNNVVQQPSAKDIVEMLKFSYLSLMNERKQSLKKAETISLTKLTKDLGKLRKPLIKQPRTSQKDQVVIEITSGTSKITSSFFGKKLEQVLLESDSEDEVVIIDAPHPQYDQNHCVALKKEPEEGEYIERKDVKDTKSDMKHPVKVITEVQPLPEAETILPLSPKNKDSNIIQNHFGGGSKILEDKQQAIDT